MMSGLFDVNDDGKSHNHWMYLMGKLLVQEIVQGIVAIILQNGGYSNES